MNKYEKIDYVDRKPYKLSKIYIDDRKNKVKDHWHNSVEIIYPVCGNLRIINNGEEIFLSPPNIFIVNSRFVHSIELCEDTEAYIGFCLQVDFDFLKYLVANIDEIEFNQPNSQQLTENCKKIILEMYSEEELGILYNRVYIESQLLLLIYTMLKYMKKDGFIQTIENARKRNKKIDEIVKYVEKNYKEDISVESIAQYFDISSGHLTKLFKENLDVPPKEYLLSYRLKKATQELVGTDEPIIDIALNNGFASLNSFYVHFRKHFGISPAKYRKIKDNQ